MPYIHSERRLPYDKLTDTILRRLNTEFFNDAQGDLCYCVYRLMLGLSELHGERWYVKNQVKAAVQAAVDEFHDRQIRPHEDLAIEKNGDVTIGAEAVGRLP